MNKQRNLLTNTMNRLNILKNKKRDMKRFVIALMTKRQRMSNLMRLNKNLLKPTRLKKIN